MRPGRPRKNEALVLRDQYWATRFQKTRGEPFASIERSLCPDMKVTRREDGGGYSQPFALSKVAAGTRGLGSDIDVLPAVVSRGEEYCPNSSECFRSVLWRVLAGKFQDPRQGVSDSWVAAEVRGRLRPQHVTRSGTSTEWRLTELGIRRVGRLSHIDALGLLLLHSPPFAPIDQVSLLAEDRASAVVARLCVVDSTFQLMKESIVKVIRSRFPFSLRDYDAASVQTFKHRRIRAMAIALATMLRGGQ